VAEAVAPGPAVERLIQSLAHLSDRERLNFARSLDAPTMDAAVFYRSAPSEGGDNYIEISAVERRAAQALDTFLHDGTVRDVSATVFFDPAFPEGARLWSYALVVVRAMARALLLGDAEARSVLAPAFDLLTPADQ
jgi:hypothetical protein